VPHMIHPVCCQPCHCLFGCTASAGSWCTETYLWCDHLYIYVEPNPCYIVWVYVKLVNSKVQEKLWNSTKSHRRVRRHPQRWGLGAWTWWWWWGGCCWGLGYRCWSPGCLHRPSPSGQVARPSMGHQPTV
jgi:hypothetical protein